MAFDYFHLLLPLLFTGLLVFVYALLPGSSLRNTILFSKVSIGLSMGAAAVAIFLSTTGSDSCWSWITYRNVGIEFQADLLGTIVLAMVSIIGLVVLRFSFSYLEGDPFHKSFIGLLSGVLSSVQLLLVSANLATFMLVWILSSLLLQRLLLVYPERKKARLAAQRKFILARIGDLALIIGFGILYFTYKTANIPQLIDFIGNEDKLPFPVSMAACCLVLCAVLKSAQFPFHGWLLDVMEAPTPVSAILHAGLINAGPFLMIRFAPLIGNSIHATVLLFCITLLSTLYGALVFAHQPAIKNSLGYSSVAHLGFSLLLCSLGMYSAALLHLIAHSFFKAYAFLTAGNEIERSKWAIPSISPTGLQRKVFPIIVLILLNVALGFIAWINLKPDEDLLLLFLFFLLSLTIYQIRVIPLQNSILVQFGLLLFSIVTMASFYIFELLFRGTIHVNSAGNELQHLLLYITIILFTTVILLRIFLINRPGSSRALLIHFRNGLYIQQFISRSLRSFSKQS